MNADGKHGKPAVVSMKSGMSTQLPAGMDGTSQKDGRDVPLLASFLLVASFFLSRLGLIFLSLLDVVLKFYRLLPLV
jgi:hypothetical protein